MDRPNASLCEGKYSVLDTFCYGEFSVFYTIDCKPNLSSCVYQPYEFQDKLVENIHEECDYLKQIKLMKSQTKMRCRQIRRILQYHVTNKFFILSQSTYHLPLLFYAFTDEKQLLSGCPPGYQKKHPGTWFQDAVKIIKVTLNHTMIFSV